MAKAPTESHSRSFHREMGTIQTDGEVGADEVDGQVSLLDIR